MIRLLIIEDMEILRCSLTEALNAQEDLSVVAASQDARDALPLCRQFLPDLALLDIRAADGSSGLEAARELRKEFPSLRIVIFTGMFDPGFLEEARSAGADSFIYKNLGTRELAAVLRSTMNGYRTFPEERDAPQLAGCVLSERETAILRLTCEGRDRAAVALALGLSESTVKTYIRELLAKTGFTSLARLAIYAVSNGFISPSDSRA